MATGADLDESIDPSRASMDAPWSGLASVTAETLAGSLDGAEHSRISEGRTPSRGATVGRYVILARLGAGAMGVVFTAHDPELDRRVALKILRLRGSPQRMLTGHRRLLAEAQAMARLSHPHVVGVHDVGEHEGQVFVAMEFVEGRTLAAWLEQGRHAWPEVLDVMTQAGRGLAAAHARDLVHRDFKPDNVMIGNDGRVRVMDFGLARAADGAATDDVSHEVSRPRMPALSLMLTVGDGMVGTPAYAAPEQLAGGRGGAAGDQFSFCVTFWEALHGRRPFVAETLPELAAKILAGEIAEPPPDSRVPSWLRRIVERGLSVDPERRWPSMDALLAALARGRARARWRRGLGAAGLVVALAAGAAGWRWQGEQRRVRACEAEGAAIAEVWNEEIAAEVRAAMIATGVSHAEVTAGKLAPWLDAHASAWTDARTEACRRGEVEGTWDADVLDRSRWCLDERRKELGALVGELRQGDPGSVDKVVLAAARLGRMEACTDPFSLSRMPIPPAEQREAIAEARDELLRADALQAMGSYDEGLAVARAALERAEALGWLPLVATARYRVGMIQDRRGEYADAEAMLETAYFEAGRADAMEVAADAASGLVAVVADRLARHADGLRWAHHQEVALTRTPDPTGLRQASHLGGLALVRHDMGELGAAKQLYEQALALREQALGPEHPEVLDTLGSLAIVLHDMGAYEEARAINERGIGLREQTLGPDHPDVGKSLNNLAINLRALGRNAEAKALYERAWTIWKASLGPEHPHVAQVINNLANTSASLGELEAAEALHLQALAIREKVLGPDHPLVAQSLGNLAGLYDMTGESRKALEFHERTLAIVERTLGPEHPDVARALFSLATVHHRLYEHEPAKLAHERALAIREKALGPDHPYVAQSLVGLADVYRALALPKEARPRYERALGILEAAVGPDSLQLNIGLLGLAEIALMEARPEEAVALAERAVKNVSHGDGSSTDLAYAHYGLARARWVAGEDRPAALALAESALATFRELGDSFMVGEVQLWIVEARAGSKPR